MRVWLTEKRKAKNLSQAELARKVGISQPSLFYIESGKRNPKVKTAKRIAAVLDFDWTEFFNEVA